MATFADQQRRNKQALRAARKNIRLLETAVHNLWTKSSRLIDRKTLIEADDVLKLADQFRGLIVPNTTMVEKTIADIVTAIAAPPSGGTYKYNGVTYRKG